ncbi:MAG TPA: hypothetical protein VMD79_07830 [Solirubrobacteraceae bacterium]|nr:hypothetical protein [Solirubrobacteraceae bacterium]
MLIGYFTFLKVSELPAKGNYPPSLLVSLFDDDSGEAVTLMARDEVRDQIEALEPLAEVALRLRWRQINLNELGGSAKGKAFRLQVVGVADTEEVS